MSAYAKFTSLPTLVLLTLMGCAAPKPQGAAPDPSAAAPEGLKVMLVVARDLRPGYGPLGVGERFPLDGRIVAYASFSWTDPAKPWGDQGMEWRWYSGDRLVKRSQGVARFSKAPHYVWNITQPLALGAGKGRVELVWNDQVLASRRFEVLDTSQDPPPPMPPGQPS